MTYLRELKFHARLQLSDARLLPITRDGRDYSAVFTVSPTEGPRFKSFRGRIRVGISGSQLAVWGIADNQVEVVLNGLAIDYLVRRIQDNALTESEELQITTYNAHVIGRPEVESRQPQLGPIDLTFSRWVRL